MTENTREFLIFIAFAIVWTGAAGLFLKAEAIHPVAIFAIWIIGFVWGVGYIVSGKRDADYFVLIWLGPPAIVAAIVYAASFLIGMA